MVVGLLLMCFPLKGIVCMIIAAVIAAGIPLPKPLRKEYSGARRGHALCHGFAGRGAIASFAD